METFLKVVGVIVMIFAVAMVLNYPLMLAMNYLFSATFLSLVFGAAKLTFWRTYVLNVTTGWLFARGK